MSSWFEELMNEIDKEAKRLAEMDGTMEEKEKSLREVSFPRIMEKFDSND